MAMTISIKNKDNSQAGYSLISYLITKYFDKYGVAEITCTPHQTIQENSILEATFKGAVRFRGYIDVPEVNEDKTARIVAYEIQRLLEYRFTQLYTYVQGTSISLMLTHAEPTTCVGLLYMANSLIPQGAFTLSSGAVYYIKDYLNRGGGTSSKFRTITKMYANAILMTHGASPALPTGTTGYWYQNGSDLYVTMPTTGPADPQYWLVSIPNWKDTTLRLDTASIPVATSPAAYRTGKTNVSLEVDRMVKSFGKEWQWYHDTNGYTYLKVATQIGRGTAIKGVVAFRENDTIYTYAEDQTGDPRIDGLVGAGSGSGITQNVYSLLNLYTQGMWKEDIYEDSHQFREQLINSMPLVLPEKMEPLAITLTSDEDPAVQPGDFADILKETSLPITKRIKQIEYANDGEMRVMLGQRILDFQDVTKGKYDVLGSYNDFVNSSTNSWSFSFNNDNISNTVPFHQTFKIASDEIDSDYPYRFRMDVNIGWYKDPAGTVTTVNHAHGGSTGTGGICGSGGSSAQHNVPQTGTQASGTVTQVIASIGCLNAGSHIHQGTGGTQSGSAITGLGYSAGCSTFSCLSSVYGSVGSFITAVAIGWTSYGGDHAHSLATSGWNNCSAPNHTHDTNAVSTNSGGAHTDHAVAHQNPMVTEPNEATSQTNFPIRYDTGFSPHWLNLTININGSNVPGSPFYDYYVGESISDIDITSLVNVAGDNSIDISIAEYAGISPVRCSLYGSVHSLYVLTNI